MNLLKTLSPFLAIVLLLPGSAWADKEFVIVQPNEQLFPGGGRASTPYHADEAPGRGQKDWLALIQKDGHWYLETTLLEVKRAQDPVLDIDGGPDTGLVISSRKYPEALALMKHPALKSGRLNTPDQPIHQFMELTRPQRLLHNFELNDQVYWLELLASDYGEHGDAYKPDQLFMHLTKPEKPALDMSDLAVNENWELNAKIEAVWTGDLDNDGRADLIVWKSGYNFSGLCLYLSSISAPGTNGELPEPTGCQIGVGC